jgi:hypothetical protein
MTIEQLAELRKLLLELGAKAVPSRSIRNRLYFQACLWSATLGTEQHRLETAKADGECVSE